MIRIVGEDKSSLFYVYSADWETIIKSKSGALAVNKALTLGFEKFGKEFSIAPWIRVLNLSKFGESEDLEENLEYFYTPEMLADIGKHKLSSQYLTLLSKTQDGKKDR